MSKELLARLHPLVNRALELEPAARAAWLAEVRSEQPTVAAKLEALLAREAELDAHGFLENAELIELLALSPPLAGRRVGAYTIERQLGQGGMGTVWLARRSDGRYEGKAAVKLLNLALVDPVGSARFRREGTALARLTHPNIARLIDAGVTEEGQPFLVLEYVEGCRIDAYCNQERLPPEQRLELFLQALDAVAHAHANLIVHRDIKPSNILVTGDGGVKLLDFGIAKLLESEAGSGEHSVLTELGGVALTPECAAPEQVTGGAVTTATDVYALGVLLYILLSGRHPTGEGCRSSAEHLRAIADTDPLRLSAAAATSERLRRLYAGDLDNIVAKVLRKDPAERYPTVQAFGEDLRRYLRHEPVSARRDTVQYRLGKFVRRNRTSVTLGVLVLAALLAGLAGTIAEARAAAREAHAAEGERDFALRALSRAQTVNELNHFLLKDAAPWGKPFTVGDLLARATRLLDHQRAESDADRVEMLTAIGREYGTLDQSARARELLERAYAQSRTLADPSTRANAACNLAPALSEAGERVRAEQLIKEGLDELPDEPQFALDRITCLWLGTEVSIDNGSMESVPRARAALALFQHVPFPPAALEPSLLENLAEAYRVSGQFGLAVKAYGRASDQLTALGRDSTQAAGTVYNDWALSLTQIGQPLKAESLFRKAVAISSADQSGRSVSPVLLTNLARSLLELERLPEAEEVAERAYGDARRAGDEATVNQCLLVRAAIYREQGALARADAMLAEVEPRLRRMLPPGHYAFARVGVERALLAEARGDIAGAGASLDRALEVLEANVRTHQQGGFARADVLRHRADLNLKLGRLAEAQHDAEQSLELLNEQQGPGLLSANVGRAYLSLGQALEAQGRTSDAQRAFAAAVAQLEPTLGPEHPVTGQARALAALPTAQH